MSDTHNGIPTISRVLGDGTLVELVYDATRDETALVRAGPGEVPVAEGRIELPDGEVLVPYSPRNNLLTSGCVLLPSEVGEGMEKARLIEAIRHYLRQHVELSPLFVDIAAHYVLLSWVYDAFTELGYLRFQGEFGTGKTRALLVIGALCYKPIFASGASTVSPLFHLLHEVGGTLVLDEADLRFSDATADLTKILNNGTVRGLPVLRTMTNRHRELSPHAFKVFGPKLIAMRESFQDEALESRFLTEDTNGKEVSEAIPIHLPESQKAEALVLRNHLLRWRFDNFGTVQVEPSRAQARLSPRGNQSALSLLSLIDDAALREAIGAHLAMAEARGANRRAALPHVAMVGVLHCKIGESKGSYIRLADAARAYNDRAVTSGEQPLSIKAAGYLIRVKLGLATIRTHGVYVIPGYEQARIAALAKRYGFIGDEQDQA